ncbi:MAG: DUF5985 family protein [Proteobacteria bacterium]|nr:DUF5985 family protein [Pseudomonadota bacterium]
MGIHLFGRGDPGYFHRLYAERPLAVIKQIVSAPEREDPFLRRCLPAQKKAEADAHDAPVRHLSLCAVTGLIRLLLLAKGYARTGVRLLLWSAICFVGLALNNILLFIGAVVLPVQVNLVFWRQEDANADLLRLAGFILIIAGIVSTNFGKRHRNE